MPSGRAIRLNLDRLGAVEVERSSPTTGPATEKANSIARMPLSARSRGSLPPCPARPPAAGIEPLALDPIGVGAQRRHRGRCPNRQLAVEQVRRPEQWARHRFTLERTGRARVCSSSTNSPGRFTGNNANPAGLTADRKVGVFSRPRTNAATAASTSRGCAQSMERIVPLVAGQLGRMADPGHQLTPGRRADAGRNVHLTIGARVTPTGHDGTVLTAVTDQRTAPSPESGRSSAPGMRGTPGARRGSSRPRVAGGACSAAAAIASHRPEPSRRAQPVHSVPQPAAHPGRRTDSGGAHRRRTP